MISIPALLSSPIEDRKENSQSFMQRVKIIHEKALKKRAGQIVSLPPSIVNVWRALLSNLIDDED